MPKKTTEVDPPYCKRADCFANREGRCYCLVDNDFGERPCPFFKTPERLDRERRMAANRRTANRL